MRLLTAVAVLLAGTATSALGAGQGSVADRMTEWGPAKPQPGYVQFCEDYYDGDCGPYPQGKDRPALTAEKRAQLERVNSFVNDLITPASDKWLWGVVDHWSYAVERNGQLYGDCEDYVLEKRRRLIELGWPAQSLLITVVLDEDGGGHAVLTVATREGDLVLDNLEDEILYWHETPYRFVKRQSEYDPGQWASLRRGQPGQEVPVAGSD